MLGLTTFTTNTMAQTATIQGPSFSSNPIAAGLNVGVFNSVTNTSDKHHRFQMTIIATPDCDSNTYLILEGSLRLDAGETKNVGQSWPVPANACAGQYTVLVTLELGNQIVASASGVLTVTN